MGLFAGGLAPVEFSLLGLGLVGESVFLCGAFGLACGFCSCINSLGATGFLMPDGTPGLLLERFGPLTDLVGSPRLFCIKDTMAKSAGRRPYITMLDPIEAVVL